MREGIQMQEKAQIPSIQNHRKLYSIFHLVNLMSLHSVLDFGSSLARGTMFSRRYWRNHQEHIDISQEVRLDTFDVFGVCKFPVYRQLYDNIYCELEKALATTYDMVAFVDILPFIDEDVFLSLCSLFCSHCSLLLIQVPTESEFAPEKLYKLGRCVRTSIVTYDYMVIWTNNN